MSHLEEAVLVALRDGDPVGEGASHHLRRCTTCTDALAEVGNRSSDIMEALAALDEASDLLRAKTTVRRRLDARRGDAGQARWWRAHLGRAAAILLLTAAAASALPWSPVRSWWVDPPAAGRATGPNPPTSIAVDQGTPSAGISVPVSQGRIAVLVRGASPGSVISVVWVDRSSARVSAASGSQFTYADGRAEVEAAPGPVVVELPLAAAFASLEVDGRVFLERTGGQIVVSGPAFERSDESVRFRVPVS